MAEKQQISHSQRFSQKLTHRPASKIPIKTSRVNADSNIDLLCNQIENQKRTQVAHCSNMLINDTRNNNTILSNDNECTFYVSQNQSSFQNTSAYQEVSQIHREKLLSHLQDESKVIREQHEVTISSQATLSNKKPPMIIKRDENSQKKKIRVKYCNKENMDTKNSQILKMKKIRSSTSCKDFRSAQVSEDEEENFNSQDNSYIESPSQMKIVKNGSMEIKTSQSVRRDQSRNINNSTLSHDIVNESSNLQDESGIYNETPSKESNQASPSQDSNTSSQLLQGKKPSEKWERKFVNISALLEEKSKARKLSKLYMEQTNQNDQLKDENESLQQQQRALIRLLQEKDKKLNQQTSSVRSASCERFAQRFAREINADEIGEEHVLLRRLIVKKMKYLKGFLMVWKKECEIQAITEEIDRQRKSILFDLVTKNLNGIGKILASNQQKLIQASFMQIKDFWKMKRIALSTNRDVINLKIAQKKRDIQVKAFSSLKFNRILRYESSANYNYSRQQKLRYLLITKQQIKSLQTWRQSTTILKNKQSKILNILKSIQKEEQSRKRLYFVKWQYSKIDLNQRNTQRVLKLGRILQDKSQQNYLVKLGVFLKLKIASHQSQYQEFRKQHALNKLAQSFSGIQIRKLTQGFTKVKIHSKQILFDNEKAGFFKNFHDQLLDYKAALEELTSMNQNLESQHFSKNEEIQKLKAKLEKSGDLDSEINSLQQCLNQKHFENKELQSQIDILRLTLQKKGNEVQEIKLESQDMVSQKQRLEIQVEQLKEQLQIETNAKTQLQEFLQEQENVIKKEFIKKQKEIEELQNYINGMDRQKQDEYQKALTNLQAERKEWISQLEQAAKDILVMKQKYEQQVSLNGQLQGELKGKDEQFKQKLVVIEAEMRTLIEQKGRSSGEEITRLRQQYEDKLRQKESLVYEKDEQLDKIKQQMADITKELIDATNEKGQSYNESRILRDRLKKAQNDIQILESRLEDKEKELSDVKNEQFGMIHKNKNDFLRVQEQLKSDVQSAKKEKDSLERRLKEVLQELSQYEDQIQQLKESKNHYAEKENKKVQQQIQSYKEENEKLKRQMFQLDKTLRNFESTQCDLQDQLARCKETSEGFRKKYNEARVTIDKTYAEMENYAKILETLEEKVSQLQSDKEDAFRDKERAQQEVKVIRQRYANIVGTDQFEKDFQ